MKKLLVGLLVSLSLVAPAAAYNAVSASRMQSAYSQQDRKDLHDAVSTMVEDAYVNEIMEGVATNICSDTDFYVDYFTEKEARFLAVKHPQLNALILQLAALDGITDDDGAHVLIEYKKHVLSREISSVIKAMETILLNASTKYRYDFCIKSDMPPVFDENGKIYE